MTRALMPLARKTHSDNVVNALSGDLISAVGTGNDMLGAWLDMIADRLQKSIRLEDIACCLGYAQAAEMCNTGDDIIPTLGALEDWLDFELGLARQTLGVDHGLPN